MFFLSEICQEPIDYIRLDSKLKYTKLLGGRARDPLPIPQNLRPITIENKLPYYISAYRSPSNATFQASSHRDIVVETVVVPNVSTTKNIILSK